MDSTTWVEHGASGSEPVGTGVAGETSDPERVRPRHAAATWNHLAASAERLMLRGDACRRLGEPHQAIAVRRDREHWSSRSERDRPGDLGKRGCAGEVIKAPSIVEC